MSNKNMSHCLKIFVFSFSFLVLIGGFNANILAQEETIPDNTAGTATETAITEAINLDEDIQPKDLGVNEPNLLPNSRFYFLKDWGRGISSFFTFNPVAKAELRLKFANEKLMEAKKIAEKTKNPELFKKAIDNFQKEENKLKETVQKIKQGAENPRVSQFVDKFIEQELKQQKLLGKFEQDLPAEIHRDLMLVKEESLSKFSDINLKFTSPEILAEKIGRIFEKQKGSDFRQFKNLEVLNDLKERVPETAKPAIERAINNSLANLKENMEKMEVKEREGFKDYLSSIGGDETLHLSILDQLESQNITTELRKDIETAKEKILEKIENRLENYEKKNLKDAQKKLLEHLDTGEMDDLRIIKELENNISGELVPKILEIKRSAKEKLIKTLEKAETPEEQKKILDEIENKFYDVRQLEIFKEIEEIIPPEKQEFFAAMKEKAIDSAEKEIKEAEIDEDVRTQVLEKIAGGTSEGIEILQKSGFAPEFVREITKETVAKISRRIENIQDPEKLENLRQNFKEDAMTKRIIEKTMPEFFEKLEGKRENFLTGLNKARVEKQINKAKEVIALCEKEINNLEEKTKKEILKSGLLEIAKKHLEKAAAAYSENKIGEAFGLATAVLNRAGNCQKLINKIKSRRSFEQERIDEFKRALDKFREETPGAEISEEIISGTDVAARCPMLMPPTPDTCKGKWVVEKNSNGCPIFKCLIASGNAGEMVCAKQGEKVNRNPLIGPINQRCCPGLFEIRVSKSYSVCQKEISSDKEMPSAGNEESGRPDESIQPNAGIANPASVYCEKMGYKLEIRTKSANEGQYGVCIFPDGKECEEWAFLKGECGAQYRKSDSSGIQPIDSSTPTQFLPSAQ